MKRSRFTDDQIIGILKEHEAGISAADLCRKHGIGGIFAAYCTVDFQEGDFRNVNRP